MRKFILSAFLLLTTYGLLSADTRIPSDSEVINSVLSTGFRNIMESHTPLPGKTIAISYLPSFILTEWSRRTIDAILTNSGLTITDIESKADLTLVFTITSTRLILSPHDEGYTRTVQMTIHAKFLDASRKVIIASKREEQYTDIVPLRFLKSTDDCSRFSPDIERHVIKSNRGGLLLWSFILLTGALVYFAFL